MKKKIEVAKPSNNSKIGISSSVKSKLTEIDEAYRQINLASFQHNFKVLIGHYKVVLNVPQVG